jgi:ferric-dicitrate binding protein FerR (iron transport regulator)
MDRTSFLVLVNKYLSGKATARERDLLENYDSKFENEPTPSISSDQERELQSAIFARINSSIGQAGKVKPLHHTPFRIIKIAASIFLVFGLGWIAYSNWYRIAERIDPVSFLTASAGLGEIKKVSLADGTKVILNAESRLTYPSRFSGRLRRVSLKGEAYFKAAHNPAQPFIVNTSYLEVKVLGTRFNVNSYASSAATEVSVVSGSVAVQPNGRLNEGIVLKPQQKVRYLPSDGSLVSQSVDSTDVLAWQTGELNFKNQALSEVAAILERKYNIRISMDGSLANCKVYARIGNDPAQVTLNAIATLLDAKLEIHNHSYRLTGAGCK